MFDVYLRVSSLGERTDEEATEVYEAQAREWAARNDVEIDRVEDDTNVSGAVAVADRKLEQLIVRVEAGESEGIITPWLDRFGRDLIEGCLALRRITQAGGRLVCTQDGFDSRSPGSELVFNLRMAIAQDFLSRTRANFLAAQQSAARRGVYLASRAPFGYRRIDQVAPQHDSQGRLVKDGALVVDETEARAVREVFERRAAGANAGELARYVEAKTGRRFTKSGIRGMLARRAYIGEMSVQSGRKGHPQVVTGVVPPILDEATWQAAQAKGTYFPRNGTVANHTRLSGLVVCASCGKRLKAGAYGPPENRKPHYSCTFADCPRRASMKAATLDPLVDRLLWEAADAGEPHVTAILEGDTRYTVALEAVEEAQRLLVEFRDDPSLQAALGMDGYVAGLKARKAGVEAARQHLRTIPRPAPSERKIDISAGLGAAHKAMYRDFIREVRLSPTERRGQPPEERVSIRWQGQEN